MNYIDIFVFAVPTANKEKFLDHAEKIDPLFKEYGALSVVECWGEDIPEGQLNSLHTAVMRKDDESVVAGWVVWPDKKTRTDAWERMMTDERMNAAGDMPFDGTRLIHGGFDKIFEI